MSKPLDVRVTEAELATRVGEIVLQLWQQRKQITVLEARVDELDPVEETPDDA